ncbi:CPBP family intramembrane glutamic endopeptidase, partial [Natronoarchaeum mannanilyticum]
FAGLPMAGHSLGEQVEAIGPELALALVVLAVTVNAPIEELFFRNVVQKRLAEAVSRRGAIGGAALLFGLAHVPSYAGGAPIAIAVTVGLLVIQGLIWGVAYDRTDSAVVPALCHGAYNAALFGALYVAVA